jgi:putative membrane protein
MSRRGILSLAVIVMLATFGFASPAQQSNTQSNPNDQTQSKQDKATGTTKSDKHNHSTHDNMQNDATQNSMAGASLSADDRKFVMEAAHGGMMEVRLGRLAADKASSSDVKQFGQRMVDDHSKANSELMALASQKGITLPGASDSAMMNQSSTSSPTTQAADQQSSTDTSASAQRHARVDVNTGETMKDQEAMNKLSGLSGDAFDREYVKMMVKDHEKDVKEFEKASTKAQDPDVRAFAAKTLPTLRDHLQQVRDIQSRMKSSGNTKSADKPTAKP